MINPEHVNELSRICRKAADTWYYDPKTGKPIKWDVAVRIALIHSEVSEALEGHRKGLMDDKLPHRKMLEVELADTLIRIFDLAGEEKLDLGGALKEKLEYNAKREDHKPKNRAKKHGKKF